MNQPGVTMLTDITYFKNTDMAFYQAHIHSGGRHFQCRLLSAANSGSLGAGVFAYDGCSIEYLLKSDEVFVVLGGRMRILWGEDYSRVVEALPGDVVWLPIGNRVKYQGENGIMFYGLYPVDWRTRGDYVQPDHPTDVRLFRAGDLIHERIYPESAGYASRCRLLSSDMTDALGASIHTYDGCSIEWTTHYDQATVVLDGTLRIRSGDNFNRCIEAKFGDVIYIPEGVRFKYEGEKARTFTALYPINWDKKRD